MLPGATFAIAVMKDEFSSQEKQLLRSFVEWARRPNEHGGPTHPVILLTGIELFCDYNIKTEWEKLGEPYKAHAEHHSFDDFLSFGEVTQAIHLGMPGYSQWLHDRKR